MPLGQSRFEHLFLSFSYRSAVSCGIDWVATLLRLRINNPLSQTHTHTRTHTHTHPHTHTLTHARMHA
jgi:hypothetical protein